MHYLKSVLILGSSGFIGHAIANNFSKSGVHTIGLDVVGDAADDNTNFVFIKSAISQDVLQKIFTEHKIALVINAAGRASVGASFEDPQADYSENTFVVFTILESIRRHSPQTAFVLLSSAAVYGNPVKLPVAESDQPAPISPYGFHKIQAEQIAKEFYTCFGISSTVLRIFSCFGEGQRKLLMWDLCEKANRYTDILLKGCGNESRDFIHVSDVASFIAHLFNNQLVNGFNIYNVASGQQSYIKDVAANLLHHMDNNNSLQFEGVKNTGNPDNWVADVSKMLATGFVPAMELENGIGKYVDWYKSLP